MRSWRQRRKDRKAAQEAVLRGLADEYTTKVNAGDPDALDAARDYYDNDGGSTRFEAGLAAYMVVLVVAVSLLVGLFTLIDGMAGR